MNILILNWRDPKNPRSGGAEKVTFKYASYWAKQGHSVIWLCNSFPNCLASETLSGVKFFRIGPNLGFTVLELLLTYPLFLFHAIFATIKMITKNKIDMIVDEIHGLPFFTPLYSNRRNVLLVCEVAGEIWDKMWPFPVNIIGKTLEKLIYFIYRNTETWAISQNTKDDICHLNKNPHIKILPLGIDPYPRPNVKKFPYPSAVFLGRLVRMKGVESAITATADIVKKLPKFHLYIIGLAGLEYQQFLNTLVSNLRVDSNITFCGQLSENEKYKLLAKSHFLFHPSYKEGFGLTVLEAGLMGTPTIARSGSSINELINNTHNGILFFGDRQISQFFIKYNANKKIYKQLSTGCKFNALRYNWNKILHKSGQITEISQEVKT